MLLLREQILFPFRVGPFSVWESKQEVTKIVLLVETVKN